ncbi:hypothetical protein ZWY2020_016999 [Hordeum vulgare]|nr:hypothetical protein ZWY2020_016999 [Hordeum vulgare]
MSPTSRSRILWSGPTCLESRTDSVCCRRAHGTATHSAHRFLPTAAVVSINSGQPANPQVYSRLSQLTPSPPPRTRFQASNCSRSSTSHGDGDLSRSSGAVDPQLPLRLAHPRQPPRPLAGQVRQRLLPSSSSSNRSRRSCMCSSTNHPGSFRCSLHKERKQATAATPAGSGKPASPPSIRSACSLGSKRMDSGQCARRALAPSPAAQHRRRAGGFRPRPSRLSAVSVAGERPGDNCQ